MQGFSQRASAAALVAGLASLVVPVAADAKARLENARVRSGVVAGVDGAGCAPAVFSTATRAGASSSFIPSVGRHVGDVDDIVVTDARVGGGRAQWTVQPTQDECDYWGDDPSWQWWTEERSWGLTYREPAYVLRASRHNGVRSIAGWRVHRSPTIRKARRHLGRPSLVRRKGVACRVRWKKLGLTIVFVNYGLGNPCRVGFAQWGDVRADGKPARWTAVVGGAPGVAAGTTRDFLDYELIGEPSDTFDDWTLADVWIPYGDPGYYPSVSATLGASDRVRGFEFWIGAGGD